MDFAYFYPSKVPSKTVEEFITIINEIKDDLGIKTISNHTEALKFKAHNRIEWLLISLRLISLIFNNNGCWLLIINILKRFWKMAQNILKKLQPTARLLDDMILKLETNLGKNHTTSPFPQLY